MSQPESIDAVQKMLGEQGYVCGRALATVVFLSLRLGRPLFLEGEAGVGKTEIAKALASGLGRRLIRPHGFGAACVVRLTLLLGNPGSGGSNRRLTPRRTGT